jgi:transposase
MSNLERLIRQETNPEILRDLSLFILEQSAQMAKDIERLKREAAAKLAHQEWLNSAVQSHLHKLQRRFFEHGREGLGQRARERDMSEDQLLMHAQSLAGPNTEKNEKFDIPKESLSHFAITDDVIGLAQRKDPELTLDMAEIEEIPGFFESATEITITERTFKKVVHNRQKYRVRNKLTKKETIVTAPGPLKLLPGCRYSVDFALRIVADKFMNHMPYDRQRKDLKRQGVNVPVMTMCRLAEQVAVHAGNVAERIRHDILATRHLACHLDETGWPILSKNEDNGQMWILSNQAGSYYRFEPTRSGKIADELLKGFSGAVLTDKFSGYLHFRKMSEIVWGLCWAHARREFMDLEAAYPDVVFKIVTLIDDLFAIERKARTWDELSLLRKSESGAKLDEIKALLEETRAEFFSADDLCKAIHYVLSAWKEFTAFKDDTRLPLSNNSAERALRQAVLGRKNFNGSKTINGADVAATLYTIIESCKKAELDSIDYLKYLITENNSDREALTPLAYTRLHRGHSVWPNEISEEMIPAIAAAVQNTSGVA